MCFLQLAERQADVAAQQRELADVERDNEGLRARIAVQTIHPQDVMRMNQEKTKQEGLLRSTQVGPGRTAACRVH